MRAGGQSVVQVGLFLLACSQVWAFYGLTSKESILTPDFQKMRDPPKVDAAGLCNRLGLHRKQKRICRKGKGMAQTLAAATGLSAEECMYQFRYERWNCSLGNYRKNILEKGVKETAFLYAISSAGLVHEISRACAQGRLDRCSCDESEQLENTKTWLWGGCGDNIRFGSKFTNKFLKRAKGFEKDIRARVDEHNSRAGIKIVRELVNKTCKCHGLSGSCTVETCWQQLAPFKEVGRVLKNKYEKSVRVIGTTNDATTDQTQLMKQRPHTPETQLMKQRPHPPEVSQQNLSVPVGLTELIHIDDSPDFCKASRYSPGTYGRLCNKGQNCGSICCGRGHNVQKRMYKRPCKCEVIWCCSLKCKECVEEEDVYLCK